jgi:spore coat polysaccharide biosynthesis protein SpsF (cytidylyltransferase family)
MKVVAVVQARLGSVRLPGKVLMPIASIPAIDLLLLRLGNSKVIDEVIVATSTAEQDDVLAEHLKVLGASVFRGEEKNVLSRFLEITSQIPPTIIVRITGDCPFVDPAVVDSVVNMLITHGADYSSNVDPRSFPHGLDVEAFRSDLLKWTHNHADSKKALEHVTTLMRDTKLLEKQNLASGGDYSHIRVTLDYPEDLLVMQKVASKVSNLINFGWQEIVELRKNHPEIFLANARFAARVAERETLET